MTNEGDQAVAQADWKCYLDLKRFGNERSDDGLSRNEFNGNVIKIEPIVVKIS